MLTRNILEDLTLDELRFLHAKYLKEGRYAEAQIIETFIASKIASTPSVTEMLFNFHIKTHPENIQKEARKIFLKIKYDKSFRRYKSEYLVRAIIAKAYIDINEKIPDDILIDKIKILKIVERL